MKTTKQIFSLACVMGIVLSLTSCGKESVSQTGASNENYVFKVGHVQPTEHPYHTGMEYLNQLLQERTNGQISLDIYPSSQLGAERELVESVQMNTVDIALVTSPLANFDTDWYLFDIPSIFYTKEHAYEFLDGEYGQQMLDGLQDINIKGLFLGNWIL